MKYFKKLLLTYLTAFFVLSSLTGCSKTPTGMLVDYAEKKRTEEGADTADATQNDTLLWINGTYAILTELNGWDYMIYSGKEYNPSMEEYYQDTLEDWWGVEDRETADSTLEWALYEGHRAEFAAIMEQLKEEGIEEVDHDDRSEYLYEYYDMTSDEAEHFANMYDYYEEYGPTAIDAWDYSRAVYLPSMYYLAGYYTEEEAKQKSLEISKQIQQQFTSWDDFMESYFRGYEYWAEESSDERRDIYEEIKADPNGPYSLDWNMTLEDL